MELKLRDKKNKKAIVLLSGGLDSATCVAIAKDNGFECFGLSFDYGQRHSVELDASKKLSEFFQITEHKIIKLDMRNLGGSALTDDIDVPKSIKAEDISDEIPITYVPARNTIFLSYALGWAEILSCSDIFIGVNALDYSGYPDCRPEFIESFQHMANLATKSSVTDGPLLRINTPLIDMTKAQIISKGTQLGVDYSLTTSCYDPSNEGHPCEHCDSCLLRAKGFAEAGVPDPGLP